jgi:hypothetical protein
MIRPCKEVQEYLAAFVDNQIEDDERAMVQAHVAECPACREDVDGQILLKRQVKALKRRETKAFPAPRIWANASHEWDRRDGVRLRRYQVRFAFVGACMLLMLLGVVWARLTAVHDFPTETAERDFRYVREHKISPACRTADADAAARYLRDKLHTNLPPLNLGLSRAQLLGADIVPVGNLTCGRLLYETPYGLVGIYIVPDGTLFNHLAQGTLEGEAFAIESKSKDLGMYGWHVGKIGYGLVTVKPLDAVRFVVLDAERNTQLPGQ